MNTTPNETTGTPDLTCPKCEGNGFISGLAGRSGYGDPEEELVTEECSCFAGSLRCDCCGKAAEVLIDDGTAKPLPLCNACNVGDDVLPVAARVQADETAERRRAAEIRGAA